MQLIKKYNYEDPLHMKGDPFGAADAKVAHVNQLITEVNSQTDNLNSSIDDLSSSVADLEGRVTDLESKYFIKGFVRTVSNSSTFDIEVIDHNTPIDNSNGDLSDVLSFINMTDGIYRLVVNLNTEIPIAIDNQYVPGQVTGIKVNTLNINDEWQLANIFNNVGKPFLGLSLQMYDAEEFGYLSLVYTRALNTATNPVSGTRLEIPQIASSVKIINFHVVFSQFEVSSI